ncbi:hypothetical protein F5Y03DRAFT_352171 [Xylaria venustula]|nr:hypothetical protein F5Y03DRAFT_352171 [Xylaria venustula]
MPQKPNYIISVADLDKDWNGLFAAYWDSWKKPLQATGQLTFVGIGQGGRIEAEAFSQTKAEYLANAKANPDQTWVKAEDPERKSQGLSHQIVGGGVFTMHRENPFRAARGRQPQIAKPADAGDEIKLPGPDFEAGTERHKLRRELYTQMWSWRPKMMATAHADGQGIWVLPEYRQQGAAEALMEFWMASVDSLGVEAYLEASSLAASLYLKYGFVVIKYPTLTFHSEEPSAEWLDLVHDMQSHPISIMWRPKGGKYVEGKTVLPWLGKPRMWKL